MKNRPDEVGLTTGYLVAETAGGCQVQKLEPAPGGGVRVVRVWPGDSAHLALWKALMTPEAGWVLAPALEGRAGDGATA